MTQGRRRLDFRRAALAAAALIAASGACVLAAGCGGGGGGTGNGGPNTPGGLSGSYSGRVEMVDGLFGLVTLTVKDETGIATGAVYVYDENQTRGAAASATGRHFGEHPLLATGTLAGSVEPATRAVSLSGTLSYADGQTRPVEIIGLLRKSGADKGSLGLKVGADTYTDGTFY